MLDLKRRQFITLLGGAAAAWPLAARAQQARERMRRIGVLLPAAPDDAEQQSWLGAFLQGLAQSGWITGRNIGSKRGGPNSTLRKRANMRPSWWRWHRT
jgi:putative tryptophan/tyrosine transport system substrate-binding protein